MTQSVNEIRQKLGLSDEDLAKPLPKPTQWSQPFWDAAREHRLVLRRCDACGTYQHPPYPSCEVCYGEEFGWVEAAGRATLFAYAVNYSAVPLAFLADLPYVTAIVELAEGVRMISNIVECDHDGLRNGMELEVVFTDVSDECTLPQWKPVSRYSQARDWP
jgi:uncharacterized protein